MWKKNGRYVDHEKLLGEYVCDLYKLRVLYVTKDEEKIRENAHTYAGYDISAS